MQGFYAAGEETEMCRPIITIAIVAVIAFAGLMTAPVSVRAQLNLDARRSIADVFVDGCTVCHASPYVLKPTNAEFLLTHYTTGQRQAAAMVAYLDQMRREGPPPPPVRPRRPSDNIEVSKLSTTSTGSIEEAPPQAATVLGQTQPAIEAFEE